MAVAVRTQASNSGASTNANVTVPGTAVTGDLLLLAFTQGNTDVQTTSPSTATAGPTVSNSTGSFVAKTYLIPVDGTTVTAGTSLACAMSATRQWGMNLLVLTGADIATLAVAYHNESNANVSNVVMPSLVTGASEFLIELACSKSNGTAITDFTAPGGWTKQSVQSTANTFGPATVFAVGTAEPYAAGTYGSETWTPNQTGGAALGLILAIKTPGGSSSVSLTQAATGTDALSVSGNATTTIITGTTAVTSGATTTSLAVNLASNTTGDLNVITVSVNSTGTGVQPVIATPSGWTLIGDAWKSGTPSHELASFYRFRVGGDASSVTVTWTATGNAAIAPIAFVAGKVDTSTPIVTGESSFINSAGPTLVTGALTLAASRYIISVYGNRTGATFSTAADGSIHDPILVQGASSFAATVAVCGTGALASSGAARSLLSGTSSSVNNAGIIAFKSASATSLPIANAGSDLTGVEPYSPTISITGSASGGTGVGYTYAWRVAADPTGTVTLSGATSATVSFTPPGSIAAVTVKLGLTVTDSASAISGESFVSITVLPVTERAVVGGIEVPLRIQAVVS